MYGKKKALPVLAAGSLLLAGATAGRLLISTPTHAASAQAAPASAKTGIRWSASYEAAQAEARKTGKPLLVEFYADWCPPCRRMEQTTFQDPKVAQTTRSFVPVRVDVDQNEALAGRFQVSGIPQAFILSPAGKILARTEGYHDDAQFTAFLRQGLAQGAR